MVFDRIVGKSSRKRELKWHLYWMIWFFWPSINDLSEGAALDLVAVLASGELIVVGLVFAGNKSSGKLKSRALGQTNITGKSTDFTSDFLHALFALHNCGVAH